MSFLTEYQIILFTVGLATPSCLGDKFFSCLKAKGAVEGPAISPCMEVAFLLLCLSPAGHKAPSTGIVGRGVIIQPPPLD